MSDASISAEEVRVREQLRQACAQHLEDLAKYQKTKLRSLRPIDDKEASSQTHSSGIALGFETEEVGPAVVARRFLLFDPFPTPSYLEFSV